MRLKVSGFTDKYGNPISVPLVLISTILFQLCVNFVYCVYIMPNYGYMGFTLSFSVSRELAAFMIDCILAFVAVRLLSRGKFSDTVWIIIIYLYFIPLTSLYVCYGLNNEYILFGSIYLWLCLIFNRVLRVPHFHTKKELPAAVFEMVIIAMDLCMIFISGIYTGFRISFDLKDFYEYRAEVLSYAMPALVADFFYWAQSMLPIGLIYGLQKRKPLLSVLGIIANIFCFSYNGKKSALFMFLLAVMIYVFYKEKYYRIIPSAFCGLSVLALIEFAIRSGESFISKHFIRRMMIVPPYLGSVYFEFFKSNPHDYLRSSILRRFGAVSTYSIGIPKTIGHYLWENNTNANTGLLGDAVANFGWISLAAYPLVIALTFKVVEYCSERLDNKTKLLWSIIVAYMFVSGTYFTLLWTNGIIVISLMFALYPQNKK